MAEASGNRERDHKRRDARRRRVLANAATRMHRVTGEHANPAPALPSRKAVDASKRRRDALARRRTAPSATGSSGHGPSPDPPPPRSRTPEPVARPHTRSGPPPPRRRAALWGYVGLLGLGGIVLACHSTVERPDPLERSMGRPRRWTTFPPLIFTTIVLMRVVVWLMAKALVTGSHPSLVAISSSGLSSNIFSAENTSMMAMGVRFVLNHARGAVLGLLPHVMKEFYLLSHDFCIVIFTQAMTLAIVEIYRVY